MNRDQRQSAIRRAAAIVRRGNNGFTSRRSQDSRDLEAIIEARHISRQAALNALAYVMRERQR